MEDILPEYDVVVMGTGLTECVLSGVLSVKGQKVLHIDRNDHYGGEAASVNIETLFKKFRDVKPGEEPWKKYGRVNDWNVDLVPKLLMSNGELTNILVSTDVTRYLEFRQIAGSYVQQGSGPKATVAKVPSDAGEALRSSLMGLFEKRRAKKFLEWVGEFDESNPSTHQGLNMATCTMKEVYDKFGLEPPTKDFIGHSMALYQSDDYITEPGKAKETIDRIRLYVNSMARYGKSPYIYPLFGLGELPQGFARLSAIYGGTYMLNTNVDEVLYDGDTVSGIKATMKERGEPEDGITFTTKTKKIIGDPTYFPGKVKVTGYLLKAICILTHPIDKTDSNDSLQLIIPQSQMYISRWSLPHTTSARRVTTSLSSPPLPKTKRTTISSWSQGFERLGAIEEKFMGPPIQFVMSHWRTAARTTSIISRVRCTAFRNTLDIYKRAEGHELVVEGLREA
ncbi:secretory pathway gdp dissociation inhibitor [Histoplasma capsulatum H143]|uniref:Rab GDP dissociation inhibitor n=1 Tax=Ajellomyces capsulatus (strain H143) TaxID=544712 RepID=C6H8G0_AJECH|nr:secretory pathway gdp dissociation inhibitor [Histoplasma capsulatum H143]